MTDRLVTIIGGSGFLGRYVVRDLARAGWRIRVVCRHPSSAEFLKTAGDLGQIAVVYGDLSRPETVLPHIAGAGAVVNVAGILFERGRQKFNTIHAEGAQKIALAARAEKVRALVQVSALGVNRATDSAYARSKMLGEQAVRAAFSESVILRPSVIFGAEDQFLNRFAKMSVVSPFLPAIGGGNTLFQPVYVADVARAVRICLDTPAAFGKTFELGGPDVTRMKDILEYVLSQTARRAKVVNVPFRLASIIGFFGEFMPIPPLTRDQVRLLRYDNTVDAGAFALASLGITPTPIDLVAPQYLSIYRKHGLAYA